MRGIERWWRGLRQPPGEIRQLKSRRFENGRFKSWRFQRRRLIGRGFYRKSAHAAELVAFSIVMSADAAGGRSTETGLRCGILRGCFRIVFHGEALHGLQSFGNGFLIGLGPPHFRIQALIDLAEGGVVRADARRRRVFGILRGRQYGRLGEFLVFFSVSVHDSDRVPMESGLSFILAQHSSPSILAKRDGISTPGKLDLAFRFGRNAVAGCGTIPPGADGLQDVAVAHGADALQNEWAMHASVGANDKADFYLHAGSRGNHQWVGRSQSFGRLSIFAARTCAHVRHVAELGGARGSSPDLMFALRQSCLAHPRRGSLHGSGGRNCEEQKPRPEATKHVLEPFQSSGGCSLWLFIGKCGARLRTMVHAVLSVSYTRSSTVMDYPCEGNCICHASGTRELAAISSPGLNCSSFIVHCYRYRFAEDRRVRSVISGGQFRRTGTRTVPKPALV